METSVAYIVEILSITRDKMRIEKYDANETRLTALLAVFSTSKRVALASAVRDALISSHTARIAHRDDIERAVADIVSVASERRPRGRESRWDREIATRRRSKRGGSRQKNDSRERGETRRHCRERKNESGR